MSRIIVDQLTNIKSKIELAQVYAANNEFGKATQELNEIGVLLLAVVVNINKIVMADR